MRSNPSSPRYALTPTSAGLAKKKSGGNTNDGTSFMERRRGKGTMRKSQSSNKVVAAGTGGGSSTSSSSSSSSSSGGSKKKDPNVIPRATQRREMTKEEEAKVRARNRWKKAGNMAIAMKRFERSGREAQLKKRDQQNGDGRGGSAGGGVRSRSTTPTRSSIKGGAGGVRVIRVTPKGGSEELDRCKRAKGAIQSNPGPQINNGSFSSRGVHNVRWKEKLRGLSLVTNNIALGGRDEANNKEMLTKYGITHVLNTCKQLKNFFPDSFTYLKINAMDDPRYNIIKNFKAASDFLSHVEKVKGRVLVHCIAGVSRSVCCVLMHLMRHHSVCLNQAYKHIKNVRPFIHPNEGFLFQMASFEVETFGWTSCGGGGTHRDFKFYKWMIEKKKHQRGGEEGALLSVGCASGCVIL